MSSPYKRHVIERLEHDQLLQIALVALEVAYPLVWVSPFHGRREVDLDAACARLRRAFESCLQAAP